MQRRDFFRNAAAGALGLGAHSILNAAPDIEKTGIADTYDVVVIGGGTAGTIAAIQAGRLGAKTLVIESGSQLGGTMTTGGVNFPGLFHAWGNQIIAGIGWELVSKTVLMHGDSFPDFKAENLRHWKYQVKLNEYLYACLAEEAALDAGVDLLYYSFPLEITENSGDAYWRIKVASRKETFDIGAKQIIDCSGSAAAASLAGFERMKESETQPGTLIFGISNYDFEALDKESLKKEYRAALKTGELESSDFWISIVGALKDGGFNCQHTIGANSSTSKLQTRTNIEARKSFMRIFRFLKRQKGLENLKIDYVKTEAGVRETYRVVGETIITAEDYVCAKVYPDSLCHSFYPIDLHTHNTVKPRMLERGKVPCVGLSAMVPKGARNMLVAGRCVSSDRLANSALRVQASCMAMGQAAAVAASLAAREGKSPSEIDAGKIRAVLKEHNAIVPNV